MTIKVPPVYKDFEEYHKQPWDGLSEEVRHLLKSIRPQFGFYGEAQPGCLHDTVHIIVDGKGDFPDTDCVHWDIKLWEKPIRYSYDGDFGRSGDVELMLEMTAGRMGTPDFSTEKQFFPKREGLRSLGVYKSFERITMDRADSILLPNEDFPYFAGCSYYLNDVNVPRWLHDMKAEEIPIRAFPRIDNAEVRREFVRKVGMERLIEEFGGKLLDEEGDYELLAFQWEGDDMPYLKMKNPSIGVYHVEGVPPEIKTVKEAIEWRNQMPGSPEILT